MQCLECTCSGAGKDRCTPDKGATVFNGLLCDFSALGASAPAAGGWGRFAHTRAAANASPNNSGGS